MLIDISTSLLLYKVESGIKGKILRQRTKKLFFDKRNIDSSISRQKYVKEWRKLFERRLFVAKLFQNIILKIIKKYGFYFVKMLTGLLNYFIKTIRT
jgi:hypothetical protein